MARTQPKGIGPQGPTEKLVKDKNLSKHVRNREIFRLPRKIAKFAESREIPRDFSFNATNREFALKSRDFEKFSIIISSVTFAQESLNSYHAIRPVDTKVDRML